MSKAREILDVLEKGIKDLYIFQVVVEPSAAREFSELSSEGMFSDSELKKLSDLIQKLDRRVDKGGIDISSLDKNFPIRTADEFFTYAKQYAKLTGDKKLLKQVDKMHM